MNCFETASVSKQLVLDGGALWSLPPGCRGPDRGTASVCNARSSEVVVAPRRRPMFGVPTYAAKAPGDLNLRSIQGSICRPCCCASARVAARLLTLKRRPKTGFGYNI